MNSWPELKSRVIHPTYGVGTVIERRWTNVMLVRFDVASDREGRYNCHHCNMRTLEYITPTEELALCQAISK